MKKTIAIIFGGCSSEYEVSLQSASSIIQAIDRDKYNLFLIGITKDGTWLHYKNELSKIAENTWMEDNTCCPVMFSPNRVDHGILLFEKDQIKKVWIDMAFPILHGKNGEDGTIQGLCELAGIPIIGCDTLSSALCMDKDMAHRVVKASGIKVPESYVLQNIIDENIIYTEAKKLGYPLFVKPVKAGSSFGITKVKNENELIPAILEAFQHDNEVVLEENIYGFEVGCAILGNEDLTVGELDEIEVEDGFFDYIQKYTLKASEIHMPARVEESKSKEIKSIAVKIYRALGCKDFARVDMFITPDGEIVFNEVNTIPGFTSHSRYPNMMKGIGMTFEDVIAHILDLAVKE
ncbi:D-alanine-D-serine ligase VanG [Gottschalkia acidurici 9a]|uniref:D-alanine--D-alanine ligase n=1 Tax=Gottschalkia acidurici (strain ATCC 7906 / DSM 604 / BCRC 14475 / CIP 104303 / KCTC 5404 / NCIMB 10678 / 9a) TaxID=1128398 RepID=K0AYS9_GOTA9|nr:D-alanine--D-serine ligase VanG [Gottschalkia acidurici]AFS77581.1 D-alanine-D-serine ligase VanG [Gottschalkia acidurici 9a]